VRKLGFRMEDIRILLATHGHYDHAGGVAEVNSAGGNPFVDSEGYHRWVEKSEAAFRK